MSDTTQTPPAPAPAPAIDLEPFCGIVGENHKWTCNSPFILDGWKYATDLRICVRVPTCLANDADAGRPPAGELFKSFVSELCSAPWPTNGMVRGKIVCKQCRGKGEIHCDSCDDDCGGGIICLLCQRRGKYVGDTHRIVGDHWIAAEYDRLIQSLPNPRYQPGMTDWNKPLPFIFDGGHGLISGIKKE